MIDKNKNFHFMSESDEWGTPQEFFDIWNKEYRFTLDVCVSKDNAKCEKFYIIDNDPFPSAVIIF